MSTQGQRTSLPAEQAGVLVALSGCLPLQEPFEIVSFLPPGGETRQYAMKAALRDEPNVWVVSTLGSLGDRLFLMVTDGIVDTLAEAVARAEYHDSQGCGLSVGHTLRFSLLELANRGWVGLLVGVPAMLEATKDVPLLLNVGRRQLQPLLGLLITQEELDLTQAEGVDALLDRWTTTHRNLVACRACA